MTLPNSEIAPQEETSTTEAVPTNKISLEDISKKYDELILSIKTEPIPPGLSKDDEKYRMYRKQEDEILQTTREILLTPEVVDEIWEYKTQIDTLLKNLNKAATENEPATGMKKTAEIETIDESTDPKSLERLARDVKLISDVEQLEQLDPVPGEDAYTFKRKLDRKKEISKMIERRNWGNVFTKLNEGDKVVTVLVPGADFLKIKHLNDEVFGYSRTTEILEQRNVLIYKYIIEEGGLNAEILKTDYQSSTIRIPSTDLGQGYDQRLTSYLQKIDEEMTKFIQNCIQRDLEKFKDNAVETEKLTKFQDELLGNQANGRAGKAGYHMTFGISEVDEDSMAGKIDALNQSTQVARTARSKKYSYGAEYNNPIIDDELDGIRDLREELLKYGSIANSDGITFKLFSKVKVGKNEYLKLNPDVLRDVRKNKFEANEESKDTLKKVAEYVKKINIIDSVKPFVKQEAEEGGALQKQIKDYSTITDNFLNDEYSDDEKKEIAEIIKTEEKDHNYTSADKFHSVAGISEVDGIKKCAYLSLDVVDVGVDQLLEFERLLQEAETEGAGNKDARRKSLDEKATVAGDETTEKMREVRRNIKKVLGEHDLLLNINAEKKEDKYSKDGLVLGLVGGDEITLAIDMAELEKRKLTLEDLMFEIKNATNHGKADVRMIKTVAAEATRDNTGVDKQSQTEVFKDHLKTIKKAEKGAEIAKLVEENVRKLNWMIERDGNSKKVVDKIKTAGLDEMFKLDKAKNAIKSFIIVMEKENGFDVKAKGATIDAGDLQKKIADYFT